MASPKQPANAAPAQPISQVQTTTAATNPLVEQRSWPFQSSYLDLEALEEYLDGLQGLSYSLRESGDRIILSANRDLTEDEARYAETLSGRVYGD